MRVNSLLISYPNLSILSQSKKSYWQKTHLHNFLRHSVMILLLTTIIYPRQNLFKNWQIKFIHDKIFFVCKNIYFMTNFITFVKIFISCMTKINSFVTKFIYFLTKINFIPDKNVEKWYRKNINLPAYIYLRAANLSWLKNAFILASRIECWVVEICIIQ